MIRSSLMPRSVAFSAATIFPLAFVGVLAGCGGGDSQVTPVAPIGNPEPSTPVANPEPSTPIVGSSTWVVMGSSTAAGAGASAGKGWSDVLQSSLSVEGIRLENIAKGGTTTYHGLSSTTGLTVNRPAPDSVANIDQALLRNPKVLLLAYPTNDTAAGYGVEEVVGNITTMRSAALAKGISVLVLSTQPRNLAPALLEQLRQIDTRLTASVGGCLVNVHNLLAGADGKPASTYDAGDGVHVNDAGHSVIAEAVLQTIKSGTCFRLRNG